MRTECSGFYAYSYMSPTGIWQNYRHRLLGYKPGRLYGSFPDYVIQMRTLIPSKEKLSYPISKTGILKPRIEWISFYLKWSEPSPHLLPYMHILFAVDKEWICCEIQFRHYRFMPPASAESHEKDWKASSQPP